MRWKRYVLAFLVAALVGLAILVYTPALIRELFGDRAFQLEFFLPRLLLPALVAAVAGYILPKGFFCGALRWSSCTP